MEHSCHNTNSVVSLLILVHEYSFLTSCLFCFFFSSIPLGCGVAAADADLQPVQSWTSSSVVPIAALMSLLTQSIIQLWFSSLRSSPQHKHWPTGPAHFSDRRASTLYLSLALQDHRVKCRASRLKITVARSMTNFATFPCILFLKFRYVCIA